jgi:NitT/TauT family transport system ATP-binding protein
MSFVVDGVSVTYRTASGGAVEALAPVDLTIEPGEVVTLIGPSGCGKSTLLHSMGGLLRPTLGRIALDGTEMTAPVPTKAAFVFQDYSLFPWRSVADNVAIGLRFAGVSRKVRRARALEQLELVGLSEFADAYPGELSGGMQQRVAIARALTMDPEALLMDEPFGALDEQSRRRLGVDVARILRDAGKTIVLVTHSLDEAIFWGDRVVVMSSRPGRIIEEIHISEPHPRALEYMTDPGFDRVRARLFELLTDGAAAQPPVRSKVQA